MHKPERDYKTDDYYVGDHEEQLITPYDWKIGDRMITLESTTNDSLAVIGQSDFDVCQVCGYATDGNLGSHRTPYGYPCKYNPEAAKHTRYHLTHVFKTDVVKVTFHCPEAKAVKGDSSLMLSVMYALLEGLSRELEIERNDIKGCLHRAMDQGNLIYTIVLYDAVAGGAGHVRRLVAEPSSDVLQRVLRRAYHVVSDCTCDPSCYQCLRNYYNQKLHDQLN